MMLEILARRRPNIKGKFIVVSNYGWCWNMAVWLKDEGHESVVYIHEEDFKHVGDGLVDKVDILDEVLRSDFRREWILVADNIGMGRMLDEYRRQGWRVWGGSSWADRMEKDRSFAMQVFQYCGIKVPFTYTAQGIQDARNFIQKYPMRWVLKPHDNKVQVYIADGVEDALEVLDWWESLELSGMEIDVQQFIEGRNIDVELWYGNGIPFLPANYDIETKKFMVDDLGMTVGCMSSICWFSYETQPRVIQEVLLPFAEVVRRVKWTGPASINIMIEDGTNELYALELTPRIGYNAYYCLHHLKNDVGWGEIIWRMCNKEGDEVEVIEGLDNTKFAVGIEVSIPPCPIEHPDKRFMRRIYDEIAKGVPIWVQPSGYPAHVHLCDVMKDKNERIVCAGTNGIVAEVIAVDEDPHAALRKCVETVKMLKIPNKQARMKDALDDFDKYYPKWTKQNIVPSVASIPTGIISPSIYAIYSRQF